MANIPIKPRRTGTPWWLWLVLALVLAALAWLAFDLFSDGDVGDTPAEVQSEIGAAAPLTSPAPLPTPPFRG